MSTALTKRISPEKKRQNCVNTTKMLCESNKSTASSETTNHSQAILNITAHASFSHVEIQTSSSPYYIAFLVTLLTLSCFSFFVNSLTLVVFAFHREIRTPFNIAIISLCVSDVLSSVLGAIYSVGFYHVQFTQWHDYFKVMLFMTEWTCLVTSCHICTFAALRCWVYLRPFWIFTKKMAKVLIFCIWTVNVGNLVAFMVLLPQDGSLESKIDIERRFLLGLEIILSALLVFTTVSTSLLLWSIHRQRKARNTLATGQDLSTLIQDENFIMVQLLLIVGCYFFGYIPRIFYYHYYREVVLSVEPTDSLSKHNVEIHLRISAVFCLRLSECFNPLFYSVASSKLRQATKTFVRRCWKKCRCRRNS